ncbi:hypothetical protein BV25DRAFT_1251607 [Artomyces pyxidatus]|uniref:Uncharacterized protein n=1 Tax=Artomyces pyxidatus TaxID=48021 RepID=A0ACB8TEK2_9AGAM|nr:hypothetical protein BV25DRAFT_1251607 [Artomyces pyxidatus]
MEHRPAYPPLIRPLLKYPPSARNAANIQLNPATPQVGRSAGMSLSVLAYSQPISVSSTCIATMSTFAMASVTAETQVPLYTYQKGANPEHTLYKLNDRQPIWKETEAKPLRPVAFPLQTSTDFLPMTVYFRHNGDFNADKLRMVASFDGDRVFRSDWFKLSGSGATFVDRWYFYFNTIGPLQFRGDFTWHIEGENGWLVATAESRTELEVYSIINWQRAGPVVAKLWSPHGVSANFMRAHVPKFMKSRQDWPLARYYNDIVQSVFDTPLKYDTYAGNAHFSTCYDDGSAGLLNVDLYTTVLESGVAHQALVNCYDLTGMIKVTLSLLPEFQAVHTYRLDPFGFIKSTTCDNLSFNHSIDTLTIVWNEG